MNFPTQRSALPSSVAVPSFLLWIINMKVREVRPEKLDALPSSHPDALASRRDLRRLNSWFGTFRWFSKKLPIFGKSSKLRLELGAGDGSLSAFLQGRCIANEAKRTPSWHCMDIRPEMLRKTKGLEWHLEDLLKFNQYDQFDVIFGNLILHQFKDDDLRKFGESIGDTTHALVFQEPWRSRFFMWGSHCLTRFLHPVTRHDAAVSVRAGFRGEELPHLLGLNKGSWKVHLEYSPLGMYRMVALR